MRGKKQKTSLSDPESHESLDRKPSRRLRSAWSCPLRGGLGGYGSEDAQPFCLYLSFVLLQLTHHAHVLLPSVPQFLPTARSPDSSHE